MAGEFDDLIPKKRENAFADLIPKKATVPKLVSGALAGAKAGAGTPAGVLYEGPDGSLRAREPAAIPTPRVPVGPGRLSPEQILATAHEQPPKNIQEFKLRDPIVSSAYRELNVERAARIRQQQKARAAGLPFESEEEIKAEFARRYGVLDRNIADYYGKHGPTPFPTPSQEIQKIAGQLGEFSERAGNTVWDFIEKTLNQSAFGGPPGTSLDTGIGTDIKEVGRPVTKLVVSAVNPASYAALATGLIADPLGTVDGAKHQFTQLWNGKNLEEKVEGGLMWATVILPALHKAPKLVQAFKKKGVDVPTITKQVEQVLSKAEGPRVVEAIQSVRDNPWQEVWDLEMSSREATKRLEAATQGKSPRTPEVILAEKEAKLAEHRQRKAAPVVTTSPKPSFAESAAEAPKINPKQKTYQKALRDLESASVVPEPREFAWDTTDAPKKGKANSFVEHHREGDIATDHTGELELIPSKERFIYAYDPDGNLVGQLVHRTSGYKEGAIEIVVRDDAKRSGWGTKLLNEAERLGIDIPESISKSEFTPEGRGLFKKWFDGKAVGEKPAKSRPLPAEQVTAKAEVPAPGAAGKTQLVDQPAATQDNVAAGASLGKAVAHAENAKKPLFVRFSTNIEADTRPGARSRVQKAAGYSEEDGISVVPLLDHGIDSFIGKAFKDLPSNHPANIGGRLSDYAGDHLENPLRVKAWIADGKVVGYGYDGEPLLRNVRNRGELTHREVADYLLAWAKEHDKRTGDHLTDYWAKIIEKGSHEPPKEHLNSPKAKEAPPTKEGLPAVKPGSTAEPKPIAAPEATKTPTAEAVKAPYKTSNPVTSRNFRAGQNNGTMQFESPLQRDLYDIAAIEARKKRGAGERGAGLNPANLERRQKLIGEVSAVSDLAQKQGGIEQLAREVYADVRAQMKGVRDGETRVLRDQVGIQGTAKAQTGPVAKPIRQQLEDALIAPKLGAQGEGVVVKVKSFGEEGYVPLIETYKGKQIVKTGENYSVWDPKHETLFVVALDDSKSSGKRTIYADANNVESARKYIDWVTAIEEKRAAKPLQESPPAVVVSTPKAEANPNVLSRLMPDDARLDPFDDLFDERLAAAAYEHEFGKRPELDADGSPTAAEIQKLHERLYDNARNSELPEAYNKADLADLSKRISGKIAKNADPYYRGYKQANGDVKWDMRKPTAWVAIDSLPEDLQRSLINYADSVGIDGEAVYARQSEISGWKARGERPKGYKRASEVAFRETHKSDISGETQLERVVLPRTVVQDFIKSQRALMKEVATREAADTLGLSENELKAAIEHYLGEEKPRGGEANQGRPDADLGADRGSPARGAEETPAGRPEEALATREAKLRAEADKLDGRADALDQNASRRSDDAPGSFETGRSGRSPALNRRTMRAIEGPLNDTVEAQRLRALAAETRRKADKVDPALVEKDQTEKARRDAANATIADFMRETLKPGDTVKTAGNPVVVKRVNAKSITTESGTTYRYDEISPDGSPDQIKSAFKEWKEGKSPPAPESKPIKEASPPGGFSVDEPRTAATVKAELQEVNAKRQSRNKSLNSKQRGAANFPDAEDFKDALHVAKLQIELGYRTLAEFSDAMVKDFGEWVKPYLEELHAQATGKKPESRIELTPEHYQATNEHLVEKLYKEHPAARREREATFIIGGPGAGKSTLAERLGRESGAAPIDADLAKPLIDGFKEPGGSSLVHRQSQHVRAGWLIKAAENGDNIIVQGTGSDYPEIARTIKGLRDVGYTVKIVHVDVPPEIAVQRVGKRVSEGGHHVPEDVTVQKNAASRETYRRLKEEGLGNEYQQYDNSGTEARLRAAGSEEGNPELRGRRRSEPEGDRGSSPAPQSQAAVTEGSDLPGVRNLPEDLREAAAKAAQEAGIQKGPKVSVQEYAKQLQELGLTPKEAVQKARAGTLTPQEITYLGHLQEHIHQKQRAAEAKLAKLQKAGATPEELAAQESQIEQLRAQRADALSGFVGGSSAMGRAMRNLQELNEGTLTIGRFVRQIEKRIDAQLSPGEMKRVVSVFDSLQDAITQSYEKAAQHAPEVPDSIKAALQQRRTAAISRLKDKTFRIGSGIDPTIMVDLVDIGVSYIAEKTYDFGKFSARMVAETKDVLGRSLTKDQLRDVYQRSWKKAQRDVFKGAEFGPNVRKETGPFGPRGGKLSVGIDDPAVRAARESFLKLMREYDRDSGFEIAANWLRGQRLANPISRVTDTMGHLARIPETLVVDTLATGADSALFPRLGKMDGGAYRINLKFASQEAAKALKEWPSKAKDYLKHGEEAGFLKEGESLDVFKFEGKRESNSGIKPIDAWVNTWGRVAGTTDIAPRQAVKNYVKAELAQSFAIRDAAKQPFTSKRAKQSYIAERVKYYLEGTDESPARMVIEDAAENAALEYSFAEDNLVSAMTRGAIQGVSQKFGRNAGAATRFTIDTLFSFPRIFWNFAKLNARFAGGAGEAAFRVAVQKAKREPFTIQDRRRMAKLVAQNLTGLASVYAGGKMAQAGYFGDPEIDQYGRIHWPTWMKWTLEQIPGIPAMVMQGAGHSIIDRAQKAGKLTPKQADVAKWKLKTGIITNQPAYTGIRTLKDVLGGDTDEALQEYIAKTGGAFFIPGGVRATAFIMDEFSGVEGRKVKGFRDAAKSQVPGLRQTLPERNKKLPDGPEAVELKKYGIEVGEPKRDPDESDKEFASRSANREREILAAVKQTMAQPFFRKEKSQTMRKRYLSRAVERASSASSKRDLANIRRRKQEELRKRIAAERR